MGNLIANALDWYVDKLNRWHVMPVNAATLVRDISSKQLSDGNFTPRPITHEHFTDAELDALLKLIKGRKNGAITDSTYEDVSKGETGKYFGYGTRSLGSNSGIAEYLSPLRTVSTTIGQAVVDDKGGDPTLRDTYDFNRGAIPVRYRNSEGKIQVPTTGEWTDDNGLLEAFSKDNNLDPGTLYARLRSNGAKYGHRDSDPDLQKIKVKISQRDMEKRLGNAVGKHDIMKPGTRKAFIRQAVLASAGLGIPVGAALGALSGGIFMLDKRRRKHWIKTMLLTTLGGAALGAAALGTTGGIVGGRIFDSSSKRRNVDGTLKKSAASDAGGDVGGNDEEARRRARMDKIKSAFVTAMALGIPAALAAGAGGYLGGKGMKFYRDMNKFDPKNEVDIVDLS